MATKEGLTSSFTLFTKSKEIVLNNLNVYMILLALPFLSGLLRVLNNDKQTGLARVADASPSFSFSPGALGLGLLVSLVLLVAYVIASIMLYVMNLQASEGKKPTLQDLWPYVKKFGWRLIGLSIVVGLVIALGIVALIVPGLIFIRRYILSPYVMIDKDLSIGESMKESARLTKPHSGSVWGVIGVTILLSLPGAIPVIGWFISFGLTSLYTAALALRYLEIKKLST